MKRLTIKMIHLLDLLLSFDQFVVSKLIRIRRSKAYKNDRFRFYVFNRVDTKMAQYLVASRLRRPRWRIFKGAEGAWNEFSARLLSKRIMDEKIRTR